MSYKFLLKPIFFILSLLSGTYLILYIEKLNPSDLGSLENIFEKKNIIEKSKYYPLRNFKRLSIKEKKIASIAWKYFENNFNNSTGLVNAMDGHPSSNLSDMTNYLMGMISAYEIGIIDSNTFDFRITRFLKSLSIIQLYQNKLPNKFYNTNTLRMTDENNVNTNIGIGWSALDIGRFFCFVNKIRFDYPQYTAKLQQAINNWKLNEMITDGYLYSVTIDKSKKANKIQEGILGYEEYCSKGLFLQGYDASEALLYNDFTKFIKIYNNEIAVDTRQKENQPKSNYLHSDAYILEGIEYGWNINSKELVYRIFKAQKERYLQTTIMTSIGEDYSENHKTISTKIAFAWYVLFNDFYADLIYKNILTLYSPQRGWYSGKYEETGLPDKFITCNTNGAILEALNYKMKGRIIKF